MGLVSTMSHCRHDDCTLLGSGAFVDVSYSDSFPTCCSRSDLFQIQIDGNTTSCATILVLPRISSAYSARKTIKLLDTAFNYNSANINTQEKMSWVNVVEKHDQVNARFLKGREQSSYSRRTHNRRPTLRHERNGSVTTTVVVIGSTANGTSRASITASRLGIVGTLRRTFVGGASGTVIAGGVGQDGIDDVDDTVGRKQVATSDVGCDVVTVTRKDVDGVVVGDKVQLLAGGRCVVVLDELRAVDRSTVDDLNGFAVNTSSQEDL